MRPSSQSIEEIADAVLDGTTVDWDAAESGARDVPRRLIGHLKAVATIAGVHRIKLVSGDGRRDSAPVQTWGPLAVLERIGAGAFGEVYRAWDTRLDREVALKLLPVRPRPEAREASTIITEGRLLARVRHPNVVTIHGAEQIGERIGLWMELVRGQTLEQLLQAGTRFTPAEVVGIGLELGRAIAAVHGAGLLHRDIKATNVMRAEDGRIVLMDFGTGRDLAEIASDLSGTPLYLAPELFKGQPASARSDVYSLGVLLYHLLTGAYPVQAKTIQDVRVAHDSERRVGLRSIRPDVPVRIATVLERAIDPDAAARYPSASALCADLVATTSRSWRSFWYVAAAASVVIAAVFVARAFIWPSSRPTSATQAVTAPVAGSVVEAPGAQPQAVVRPGERPVIAVRPFRNLASVPHGDLIADGLSHEIIRSLAMIDGLAVIAGSSVFTEEQASSDAQAFGRGLGATFVLEASLMGSPGRLRISPILTRVSDRLALWAESYDTSETDLLAVQDGISAAIVNNLRLRVGPGQRRYRTDEALYYLFLQARGLQARRHTENAARAAELFEKVIAGDPSFVPALAGLASALSAFTRATQTEEPPPPDPRMEAAAIKAISMDPWLAEAHAAMGHLYARDGEWERAEASFTKAIERNPSLTTTHSDFVLSTLLPLGKIEEGMRLLHAALAIDPKSLDVRRVLALLQVDSGLYEDAIANARWVLERDPDFPYAELWLARALVLSGRPDEALPIFSGKPAYYGYLGYLYAVTGRGGEAETLAAAHPESPARQMLIYGGLGDRDRAYEALERAAAANPWRAATWMYRPEMAILRGDPRVAALRKRIGLPE